ncbi:uncharacterized protein BJ212DRAFT_1482759 [Suillus subaureus]|uniref:Uncharacterized protein n=1 Tax=Suillus subaureus TaxID=48587 RepID=A0A9P7E795_9AGAM|nr:uncharacterized protein BJ212DRAFT_1482759 [Suillus subaureus]KAG1813305.1 hypothetical protein BJ212DRAFT_1482759 [Suillus subaureus]
MLPSWLSKKSNNLQASNQPDHISKTSHSTVELTGNSSQSAIPITDDDHNDIHEHIWDPSTYSAPTEQDALKLNTSATSTSTSSDLRSLGHSTEPARFLTPHDDILAELQGYLPLGGPQAAEQQSLRPDAPLGSSLNLGPSIVDNSLFTSESLPNHEPAKEIMYEPSTGQRLYDYVPTPVRSGTDDELWSHLSHILELQSEISKMHVDMENVGLRTARGHNGPVVPERGGKAGTTRSEAGKDRRRSDTLGEEEGDDESDEATEGEDSDDNDEVFGKRKREEQFTRLAERFAERKVSIDAVMNKLDNLSSALKAFHALPTPVLDLTCFSHQYHVFQCSTGNRSHYWCGPRRYLDDISSPSPVGMHHTQSILDRSVGKK